MNNYLFRRSKLYFCFIGIFFLIIAITGCNSSNVEAVKDAVNGVPRKDIDRGRLAINAFANDPQFGSAQSQFDDVKVNLGINRVRILFAWNEGVHPQRGAPLDFNFYDSILSAIPGDMRAIVVLTGIPVWLSDGDEARKLFVNRWVRSVVERYGSDDRIEGFQIWNEPNDPNRRDNAVLGFIANPLGYVDFLRGAYNVVKSIAPGKLVISAASTAINQSFPETLDYNRGLRDNGVEDVCDIYAIHYYGSQYENVSRKGGIADVLNSLNRPIWLTESGAQGINSQLEYGERTWPFLFENIQGLQRVYIYQYTENSPSDTTYGLRNPSANLGVSDLYVWLSSAS
jgi:hypothetical protein